MFVFKFTDLCIYCETGRIIKKELIDDYVQNHELESQYNLINYKAYYTSTQNENMLEKIENLEEIEYHKNIADRQREIYNKFRKDTNFLGADSILIEVDWKEKIYFGKKSPRQVNVEWYKYGSCSLLSFGIYYTCKRKQIETDQFESIVNCLTIDILTDDTSQTASDYIKRFRFIRNLQIFKSIEKKNYIIFSDTAKQFRCEEICHFYLIELANEGIRVSFNFFCEYHGKVCCFI